VATSIKLDDGLKVRIERLAKAQRRSAHWIMCEAIRQYVEREERGGPAEPDLAPLWTDTPSPSREDRRVQASRSVGSLTPSDRPEAPDRPAGTNRYSALLSLAGAGRITGAARSVADVDAHIRWLRDND
jgi:Ribbon-helix-helix protein, copG family